MSLFVSSFHSCWDIYPGNPYDICDTEKEFFLGAIRRGSIYWTAISVLMLIIFLTVKEDESKTDLVQRPIIKQQETITATSTGTIPAHPNFCPDCGSKIRSVDQKFCVNCGKELSDVI